MNTIEKVIKSMNKEKEPLKLSNINIEHIYIQENIYPLLQQYLLDQNYTNVLLVGDDNTVVFMNSIIEQCQNEHLTFSNTVLLPNQNQDVIADEQNVCQSLIAAQQTNVDAILAVGSGTIHDVARYVAFTLKKPFVSFPTAPSVDGFYSSGAPLILRNMKVTVTAKAPKAIFADLHILKNAPKSMIAAGVGDILGKYTSIFDWKFETKWRKSELYEPTLLLTEHALAKTVNSLSEISLGYLSGISRLMEALIESGIGIALYGQSHSASGSEHHLSHFWEIHHLINEEKQLLHGEKVSVATIEILRLYQTLFPKVYKQHNFLTDEDWDYLKKELDTLPTVEEIIHFLKEVEGKTELEQLPISSSLFNESIFKASSIRPNRYTFLRFLIDYHSREVEQYVTSRT